MAIKSISQLHHIVFKDTLVSLTNLSIADYTVHGRNDFTYKDLYDKAEIVLKLSGVHVSGKNKLDLIVEVFKNVNKNHIIGNNASDMVGVIPLVIKRSSYFVDNATFDNVDALLTLFFRKYFFRPSYADKDEIELRSALYSVVNNSPHPDQECYVYIIDPLDKFDKTNTIKYIIKSLPNI